MRYYTKPQPAELRPSDELIAFVKRQIRNARLYIGPERRGENRELVLLPVVVAPIDEDLNPLGPPLAMVTQSMSINGVGLVHEQPIVHDRIALRMVVDDEQVILTGDICWRKPLGPFYTCGCKVNGKFDQSSAGFALLHELLMPPASARSRLCPVS